MYCHIVTESASALQKKPWRHRRTPRVRLQARAWPDWLAVIEILQPFNWLIDIQPIKIGSYGGFRGPLRVILVINYS